MKGWSKATACAWTGLLVASMLMLALGSTHSHDYVRSLQVTAPHSCFLCQVSPGLEIETGFESRGTALPAVPVPLTSTSLAPPEPDLSTRSARSPPP